MFLKGNMIESLDPYNYSSLAHRCVGMRAAKADESNVLTFSTLAYSWTSSDLLAVAFASALTYRRPLQSTEGHCFRLQLAQALLAAEKPGTRLAAPSCTGGLHG